MSVSRLTSSLHLDVMSAIALTHISLLWSTGNAASMRKPCKHPQRDRIVCGGGVHSRSWDGWGRIHYHPFLLEERREIEWTMSPNAERVRTCLEMHMSPYRSSCWWQGWQRVRSRWQGRKLDFTSCAELSRTRAISQVHKSRLESPGVKCVITTLPLLLL